MTEPSAPRAGRVDLFCRWAILGLTLLLCCVVGLLTPYLLGVVAIVCLVLVLLQGRLAAVFRETLAAPLFLGVIVALGIAFAITARTPRDVVPTVNFIMLALYAPMFGVLSRGARPGNADRVAALALGGAALAAATSLFGLLALHWDRAQSPVFGAILLGNTTLLLGFLSLLAFRPSGRRWVFALGPPLGVIVIALTGSRGPLLAILPLTIVAAGYLLATGALRLRSVAALVFAFMVMVGVVVLWPNSRTSTIGSAISGAAQPLLVPGAAPFPAGPKAPISGSAGTQPPPPAPIGDVTAGIRLALWRAAWQAVRASPLIGYGWAHMMSAVTPYLSPADRNYAAFPQLHNDLADFAVAAGAVGVVIYLVLLLTPLVGAVRQRRDSQSAARLYGAAVLVVAYACDGLTDLMFGFEFHTALFVALTAILLGYCRDQASAALGDELTLYPRRVVQRPAADRIDRLSPSAPARSPRSS